jgi:preprotein translocase subunit SecA
MFQDLLENIKFESVRYLSKVTVSSNEDSLTKPKSKKMVSKHEDAPSLFDTSQADIPNTEEKPKNLEGNRKLRRMQAKANRKKGK